MPTYTTAWRTPTDGDCADFLLDSDWDASTKRNAVGKLDAWCRWLDAHGVALVDAGHRDLRAYLAEREQSGTGPSTRRKDWQIIRALYAWAARPVAEAGGELIARDPMLPVNGPRVTERPATRAAKPDEVAALESYFATVAQRAGGNNRELARRNAAMVSLMWRSGVRVGELPVMDLADVIEHRSGRMAIQLDEDDTKNGEPRLIPVHPETQRHLERYLRLRGRLPGPLFMGRLGKTADVNGRVKVGAICTMVKRAAKVTGVPVSSHQLRRGFTSQYLMASKGDVVSLEVIAGWTDPRMARRYLADEEAQAATERFYTVADGQVTDLAARRGRRA